MAFLGLKNYTGIVFLQLKNLVSYVMVAKPCPCYTTIRCPWFFDPRTKTKNEHFPCQESGLSRIFEVIVSTSGKTLDNINELV